MITENEVLWYALAISATMVLILLIGLLAVAIPMGAERQRRRDEAVSRDFESRKAELPAAELNAAADSALTEGRISPRTIQRLIDGGYLDPRP